MNVNPLKHIKLKDFMIIDENELHQNCSICMEKYDIAYHRNNIVYENTPILINCGHTLCY